MLPNLSASTRDERRLRHALGNSDDQRQPSACPLAGELKLAASLAHRLLCSLPDSLFGHDGVMHPWFLTAGSPGRKQVRRPARQFPGANAPDTVKDQWPVTEPRRNIPSVFNNCSRPKLDISNSAAILRAVNRSNHKRPCTNSCSNECKDKLGLARTQKLQKPDRICQTLQANFLYH